MTGNESSLDDDERPAKLRAVSVDDTVPNNHPLNPVDLGMENDDNMFTPTGKNVNNISSQLSQYIPQGRKKNLVLKKPLQKESYKKLIKSLEQSSGSRFSHV